MPSDNLTPKFTLKQYEAYESAPLWQKDSSDFRSESEQEQYWTRQIKTWISQYNEAFKAITTQWQESQQYVENVPARSFDVFVPEVAIATERVPFALLSLMELLSYIYSNYPQPTFASPSSEFDQYAGALKQTADIELKMNSFNITMFDTGVSVGICGVGIHKQYIDYDQVGPFGEQGKIIIQRIDPLKISIDPKAARLNWDDLQYICYTDNLDLGVAMKMFKEHKHKMKAEFQTEENQKNPDGEFGTNLTSPVPNPIEGNTTGRNKVKITECWFKDDRQKFVAETESVVNKELGINDDGDTETNPNYDPDQPEIYTRPKLDKDGYVIGEMVPAYPDGRCIVIANDKHIVADFANPFWHKRAPFIFFRGRPSTRLVTTGDLTDIIRIDKKLNDTYSRIHVMMQQEVERPMVAETNTFRTPRSWFRVSGMATSIIVKNTGKEFGRLPPTEIPQFVFLYLQKLEMLLQKTMAVAGIMQGQLTEGSQLSAEAISSLQGMSQGVIKMKAEFVAEGIKEEGYQLMWNIRQTYPENITIPITLPDGSTKQVKWNEKDAASDYIVDIESGSGLPGSHSMPANQVIPLFREGLIDQAAALQALRFNGWQNIIQRMKSDKLGKIEAEAAGRAMGIRIKQFEKETDGGAGRIKKADQGNA